MPVEEIALALEAGGARDIMNATTLSKLILVAAVVGAGLIQLLSGPDLPRVAASLDQIRGGRAVKVALPASVEIARVPPGESGARFRFGFLEFEDDPEAPADQTAEVVAAAQSK